MCLENNVLHFIVLIIIQLWQDFYNMKANTVEQLCH